MSQWHAPLHGLRSRGSTADRPGSLAGLTRIRKDTAGQFFTPEPLVGLLWRLLSPLEDSFRQLHPHDRISLLDNSCGSGRLLWPADPARHILHGVDIDGQAISALSQAADQAGFQAVFINAGMEEIRAGEAHAALLNPPYGLHVHSRLISAPDTVASFGDFGPGTAALSQSLAVWQAVMATQVVLAILPEPYLQRIDQIPPLADACVARIWLPAGQFAEENTGVKVAIGVFALGCERDAPIDWAMAALNDPLPTLGLRLTPIKPKAPRLLVLRTSEPVITGPTTGDRTVRITHDGRKLRLKFACAMTEAMVRNALLVERIDTKDLPNRLPEGVEFKGQGWLDVENLLAATHPHRRLDELAAKIAAAGGEPVICPSLAGYYRRRLKTDKVRAEPFRRWALIDQAQDPSTLPVGSQFTAAARTRFVLNPLRWGSPVIEQGAGVQVTSVDTDQGRRYEIQKSDAVLEVVDRDGLLKRYIPDITSGPEWKLIHPGRRVRFPELAAHRRRVALSLGLHKFLHWQPASGEDCYQLDDVIELSMSDRGTAGWMMASGKSRLAVGLCLMGGQHNLICCEAHLVPELAAEIQKLGLSQDQWQIIESPSQLASLRRINLISYPRLRSPVARGAGRRTYARALRRRLHTVVADEAQLLRNRHTQQSQAIWMLSPKKRFAMSGTPVANYCRDALSLLTWAGADGTAAQPYGDHHPYIDQTNLMSMQVSRRGVDVFRDRHMSLEWAVREFTEDLRRGAKREVPRLRNVEQFRDLLAPHILRRQIKEPELARWITIPDPTRHVHTVPWDPDHLKAYLVTAFEFASWYREMARRAGELGNNVNLISLLAHIGQVFLATNAPHKIKGPVSAYGPITSKQRYAADLLAKFAKQGRKSILFATNPEAMDRIATLLSKQGIESVRYDGRENIPSRTRNLNMRFRDGMVPVVLISLDAGESGLNLPQASRVVYYNRSWTPKAEDQSGHRVLRPQQTSDVEFHYLHLDGSIDAYQAQMVSHKQDAIAAGLDYGDQLVAEGQFLHLTTVIGRFCDDLATRYGTQSANYRDLIEVLDDAA